MPIRFHCVSCGKKIGVADHLAGRRGKCPDCGEAFTVPAPGTPPPPPRAMRQDDTDYSVALDEPQGHAAIPVPATPLQVCPSCGRRAPGSAAFCPSCGAAMNRAGGFACPSCGGDAESGAAFCAACGCALAGGGTPVQDHARCHRAGRDMRRGLRRVPLAAYVSDIEGARPKVLIEKTAKKYKIAQLAGALLTLLGIVTMTAPCWSGAMDSEVGNRRCVGVGVAFALIGVVDLCVAKFLIWWEHE